MIMYCCSIAPDYCRFFTTGSPLNAVVTIVMLSPAYWGCRSGNHQPHYQKTLSSPSISHAVLLIAARKNVFSEPSMSFNSLKPSLVLFHHDQLTLDPTCMFPKVPIPTTSSRICFLSRWRQSSGKRNADQRNCCGWGGHRITICACCISAGLPSISHHVNLDGRPLRRCDT
ncbi:hypothetical protein ARMSODRAFT_583821 [Armillaria solidipes]|uniref:Uncharacterized protein n=1 Tax=Armillaria solidipes TaxID=1076256 RepID=A0A2H3BTU5_9AGAR|nr:hypothetical protein ARMSODRAFT_583821 [Armillaria solidipes]